MQFIWQTTAPCSPKQPSHHQTSTRREAITHQANQDIVHVGPEGAQDATAKRLVCTCTIVLLYNKRKM